MLEPLHGYDIGPCYTRKAIANTWYSRMKVELQLVLDPLSYAIVVFANGMCIATLLVCVYSWLSNEQLLYRLYQDKLGTLGSPN